ncbi:MAG: hypothetical protein PHR06_14900 [Candidatus Cloacimonetes bacterium]|nr:hypothetical protein [Candidatus Cloacimonadota bacterium]
MTDKKLVYIGAILIALLLFSTVFTVIRNSKNKRNLNDEKLRTESLLSEKLQVEKELAKLKNDFSALQEKNSENDKLLTDAQVQLSENGKTLKRLSNEARSLRSNKKELEELQVAKASIDKEYADLKLKNDELVAQNKNLNNKMTALEVQKNDLTAKLQKLEKYCTDNFEVYGSRGKKDKLTFWAFRTKKINLNFEVPQSLTETISFKMTTPSGKIITPDDKVLSWYFPMDQRNFTASMSAVTGEFEQSRQVVLSYVSKEKLEKGEYKIQIFSNGNNIGNCRFKLK